MTMAELVPILACNLDEPVVHQTALTIRWPYTVVESLGLKLERRRTPVEVLAADKMNRTATENQR
jgi:hypothetical protein